MVLKGVNWIHNAKIRLYGLERSQLGTQWEIKIFTLWILSLDWELINNFLVLNSKSTQKQPNLWFLAEIHGFHQKLLISEENLQFSAKICSFHENHGFQKKTVVFGWKLQILTASPAHYLQNPRFLAKKKVTPIFFILCTQLTLSRPYDLIFALCTQLTLFKTIWFNFIMVYPVDYFQYHMTRFLCCVPSWLLSRPYDLISVLCTQMNPFKPIWPNFIILFLTPFKTIWPNFALWTQLTHLTWFCIGYSIESFQDHMTGFLNWVHNWLISRPFDLIFVLCTQLTPFKTIWPNFIIVYPINSIEDHMMWFCIVSPNDSFQDHMTWFFILCTQLTPFKTIG